jgi:cyclophilin family peptidyl-prolyl cis-trans isomerase
MIGARALKGGVLHTLLTALLLLASAMAQGADGKATAPRIGDECIILHTIGGDIVLGLYPDVAPETCKQLLNLVRLGVYDTTHFHRSEPNFVLQLSTPDFRAVPMTPEQRSAIHPIKAEFSDLRHVRGVLSMAREDNDINSAATSFSILLGTAPHLDHQYTIFGRVEKGMDVVDELVKIPRVNDTEPIVKLLMGKAEVVDAKTLATLTLRGPQQIIEKGSLDRDHEPNYREENGIITMNPARRLVVAGLALVVVLGMGGFLAATKVSPRTLLVVNALNILIGGAMLFAMLTHAGRSAVNLEDSTSDQLNEVLSESTRAGLIGMSGVILIALLGVILTRAAPKMISSLNLINVLIGGFLLFSMLVPTTQSSTTLAAGVFIAAVSIFKLMGQFEAT